MLISLFLNLLIKELTESNLWYMLYIIAYFLAKVKNF